MSNKKLHFICGGNLYTNQRRGEIVSSLGSMEEVSIRTLESPSFRDIFRELLHNCIFFTKKVVVIRNFSYDKDSLDYFKRFIESNLSPPFFSIVLIEESDVKKIEKIMGEFTDKEKCMIEIHKMDDYLKPNDFVKMISKRAEERKIKISKDSIKLFAEICGYDINVIESELEKLLLIYDREITSNDILKSILNNKSGNALSLYVSIMIGNIPDSIMNSREMCNTIGVESVLSMLIKLLEVVLLISECKGNSHKTKNIINSKHNPIMKNDFNRYLFDSENKSVEKLKVTNFIYKVAYKVYERVRNPNKCANLFIRCYKSFFNNRISDNEKLAISQIEELITIMCWG